MASEPSTRASHERAVWALALLAGLPGSVLAIVLLGRVDWDSTLEVGLGVGVVALWLGAAHAVRRRVARSLLGVLDHFDLALDQPRDTLTVDQLLGGVRIVRDELLKALSAHGVERLDPAVGEPFDPHCHEAVMRQPCEDVEPDHIASVMQPGYLMGQMVLRPAKVVIAAPPEGEAAAEPAAEEES